MNQEVLDYNKTDPEILVKKILDCRKVLVRTEEIGGMCGARSVTYILINDDFSTVIITGLIGYADNIFHKHATIFENITGKRYYNIVDNIFNKFEYITDYCK